MQPARGRVHDAVPKHRECNKDGETLCMERVNTMKAYYKLEGDSQQKALLTMNKTAIKLITMLCHPLSVPIKKVHNPYTVIKL